MYFYIFDPRGEREIKYFERVQGKLSNQLAELKIDGETSRVTSIRTLDLLVEQAISADAKTVVVVGSDQSLNKVINAVVKKKAELTIGYIPLDPTSALSKILGLNGDVETTVKVIAARLTEELDLGRVGDRYFMSKVDLGQNYFTKMETGFFGISAARSFMKLEPFVVKLSIEGQFTQPKSSAAGFTVTSEVLGVQIINSRSNEGCKVKLGNPRDRLLDIVLLNKLSGIQIFRYRNELASGCLDNVPGTTVLHAKKVEVLGPRRLPISIEGQTCTKAPATITVARRRIKMIVGKNRQF